MTWICFHVMACAVYQYERSFKVASLLVHYSSFSTPEVPCVCSQNA